MLIKVIKAMYGASKALPLPEGMTLKIDPYRSVHLTLNIPVQLEAFSQYIDRIMEIEEGENKKVQADQQTNAVWVHLTTQNLQHAGFLCQRGFKIHHGFDQELSLYKWISRRSMLIPPFSPFVIAAGAAVIHNGKILLIRQKNGVRKGEFGLPGGRADLGEFISTCSERQLWEEVGLKAKFRSILYFRELPVSQNKHMDLYFVCLMDFQESALEEIKFCEREVSGFEWIPLLEYDAFAEKHCSATQREVARYIHSLASTGFDFSKESTPFSKGYEYISPRDQIKRYVIQHQLGFLGRQ